jgi:hypothetical protein
MLDGFLNRKKENSSRRQDKLSAHIDGELSTRQRAKLENELAQDSALRRELEELRRTTQMLRSIPTLAVPRSFTLDPAEYGRIKPRRLYLYPVMRAATVVAMLIFAFLFAGDLFFRAGVGMPAMAPDAEPMALEVTRVVEKEVVVTVEFEMETVMEMPAAETLAEPIVEEGEQREVEAPVEAVEEMAVEEEVVAESEVGLAPTAEMPATELPETDATAPPTVETAEGGVSAGGALPTATATPGPEPTLAPTEAVPQAAAPAASPTQESLPAAAPTEPIPAPATEEALLKIVPTRDFTPEPSEATQEPGRSTYAIDWGMVAKLGVGVLAAGLLIVTLIARRYNW